MNRKNTQKEKRLLATIDITNLLVKEFEQIGEAELNKSNGVEIELFVYERVYLIVYSR